jgi:hypothetical protein
MRGQWSRRNIIPSPFSDAMTGALSKLQERQNDQMKSKEVARARPKTLDDHLRSAARKVIRAVKSGRGCALTHYEAVALDMQQADGDWWMEMHQQVARDEIEALGPI